MSDETFFCTGCSMHKPIHLKTNHRKHRPLCVSCKERMINRMSELKAVEETKNILKELK